MIHRKKYIRLLILLSAALVFLCAFAMCVGRYSFDPRDTLAALLARLRGSNEFSTMQNVVFVIRIPRVLTALLVGAALAVSGTIYQSVFRNPLVSPDLLGVSSGASTGAAIAVMLGATLHALPVFAFVGGILAVLMATSLPRLLRNSTNMMLVLSGIIVSGLMNSILGLIKFMAEDKVDLAVIVFWQMGSFTTINKSQLTVVAAPILICMVLLFLLSWRINILSFGEEEAKTVGIHVKQLRGIAIVCASLLTACAVSISGTIGWIGLVIPHFGRLLCGSDNTKLLPVSAILGGMFLLLVDTAARSLTTMEIPLSILTGLFGAPFFTILLFRQKARIV